MSISSFRVSALLAVASLLSTSLAVFAQSAKVDKATNRFDSMPELRAEFGGVIGERVSNLVDNWSLRAPKANPALLSVFQLRDRAPRSDQYYVPWVGEFAGKYLTNSIQLLKMTQGRQREELQATVDAVVRGLIASQDKSGYLGAFPKDVRLLAGWDLWGHYHAIVALLLYNAETGDADALEAARRAGLFFCDAFLDKGKQIRDAGSDDMNFAIISAMMKLYRATGEERFFQAAQKLLAELENFGDFYRQGLAGTEFYATPRPRWEPLHTIESFADFYRVTGDETYERALRSLWESILKRDVHNNGSFSSGEQAVGSQFKEGAIETCCSVAWIALTVEALRLSGDSCCADALETSLYNTVAAYTHPSGSWCAYNTPMNGRREASFHTIVFQSRPGQPELNCCSVNGPRGYSELVDWSVMKSSDQGVVLNYYGLCDMQFDVPGGRATLTQRTNYPLDGRVEIEIKPIDAEELSFPLYLRVPKWANGATLTAPGEETPRALEPGEYYRVERVWKRGESIVLELPMNLRYESGDGDFAGRLCVYRGPLLLAYDQFFNKVEAENLPAIDPAKLADAKVEILGANPTAERVGFYAPWLFVKLDSVDGSPIFLTDFASAGALGQTCASWTPGEKLAPPVPACDSPHSGAAVPRGAILFEARKMNVPNVKLSVVVSASPKFDEILFDVPSTDGQIALATEEQTSVFKTDRPYFWKLVAENEFGKTESIAPARSFRIDESLPPFDAKAFLEKRAAAREFRDLIVDPLQGATAPTVGTIDAAVELDSAQGPNGEENAAVAFNGLNSELTYKLEEFPRADYEATLDFAIDAAPTESFAELASAWTKGGDDPLRVAVDSSGRIYGALEGPRGGMTDRVPLEIGRWYKLRVVKSEENWTIYLDDAVVGSFQTERVLSTDSTVVGLGCNPRYRERSEFLRCRIANFMLKGRVEAE